MGEQRNLTEENTHELRSILQKMKETNDNLEYKFWKENRITGKLYVRTKLIRALPMDECSFLAKFKGQDVSNRETRSGYYVRYPDGYESWSPKETFESAYRLVTDEEKAL